MSFACSFVLDRAQPMSSSTLEDKSPLGTKIGGKVQEIFLQKGANSTPSIEDRLICACREGRIGFVRFCLTLSPLPAKTWNRAFIEAILAKKNQILELILCSVEVPKKAVLIGANTAFQDNHLDGFKILAPYIKSDPIFLKRLLLAEVKRGKSAFIQVILEKNHTSIDHLEEVFQLAVQCKNYQALQILSLYELDSGFVLKELLEAIDQNEEKLATTLFLYRMTAKEIEIAFLKAGALSRQSLMEFFLKKGASFEAKGKALLQAVMMGDTEQIRFLIHKKISGDYLDRGLESAAQIGDLEALRIIQEGLPSPVGYVIALRSAIVEDQFLIVRELVEVHFFSLNQLIVAQDLAFECQHGEIFDFFEQVISCRFASTEWEVDLEILKTEPKLVLKDWSRIFPKPLTIRFKGQQGFGEGLTRQFYAQLAFYMTRQMLCEKGLFHSSTEGNLVEQAADFFSFMLERELKTGKIFPKMFVKILNICLNSSRFSGEGLEKIFTLLWKEKKDLRDKLLFFLKKPESKSLSEEVSVLLEKEGQILGFLELSKAEQLQLVGNFLIQKHGYWLGVDYLYSLKSSWFNDKILEILVRDMAKAIFEEDLQDKKAIIRFASDQEKEARNLAQTQLEKGKEFLMGSSRSFCEMIEKQSLDPLEGIPLESISTCKFAYQGTDAAVLEKVELIKDLLQKKIDDQDASFVQKFLFFVTGSPALKPHMVIGVVEIENEKFVQAQTCFNLLKIPRGYEQFPLEQKSWQERFLSKFLASIEETGYQLEEQ
jgi:hypothetical protein